MNAVRVLNSITIFALWKTRQKCIEQAVSCYRFLVLSNRIQLHFCCCSTLYCSLCNARGSRLRSFQNANRDSMHFDVQRMHKTLASNFTCEATRKLIERLRAFIEKLTFEITSSFSIFNDFGWLLLCRSKLVHCNFQV